MSTIKFNTDDFDKFDKQIDAALDDMNVKGLHDIIGEAAAFLDDDDRYDGNVNPTHISNATATICRAARRLMLAALPSNPVWRPSVRRRPPAATSRPPRPTS